MRRADVNCPFNFRVRNTLLSLMLLPAAAVVAQDVAAQTNAGLNDEQLWVAGSESVVRGEFDQARGLMGRLIDREPGNDQFQEVADWLERWNDVETRRLELELEQRDQDLERARRNMKKGKFDNALAYVRAAMKSAPQASDFMRESWIQELHDKALEAAREDESEGEYRDASSIYYELHQLYEGNAEYEDSMDRCLDRSRLEMLYKPDTEWEQRISGITRRMAEEALRRVRISYVVEADFQDLTRHAYGRLLLLPQSASLGELFPSLVDTQNRDNYLRRIEKQLARIDRNFGEGEFTFEDAQRYFRRALQINEQTVKIPEELLVYEYVDSGLESLDQFTSMIWPSDFAEFEKHTQGHFTGVGIQITKKKDVLTVVTPLEDSPAFRAGIQAEDQIVEIDGESAKGLSLNEAVRKITGPPQTSVVLTVHRPSTEQDFPVELLRQEIHIKTVKGWRRLENSERWDWMIDPDLKIAYIRVSNFNAETSNDLARALDEIQQENGRALILDLRFNPGGLLRSSIEVSDLFLGPKLDVVSTSGLGSAREQLHKSSQRARFDKPLIVMINEQSASASEIVSGALKDHGRAVILGGRTFGKGSVQNLIPVGPSSAHLKLTTAHYYLPSGTLIHKTPGAEKWGVEPDIEVSMTPREAGKVYSLRRDADVIRTEQDGDGLQATAPSGDQPAESAGDAAKAGPPTESLEDLSTDAAVAPGVSEQADESTVQEGDGAAGTEDEDAAEDEDEPELPLIVLPDIDYQLESALLVLRVKLVQDHGFDILPKIKLGDKGARVDPAVVTN